MNKQCKLATGMYVSVATTILGGKAMEIKQRNIEKKSDNEKKSSVEIVRVGKYECERTRHANIFKVVGFDSKYVVRCNYGKVEKIDKKKGVKKEVNEITLKIVYTLNEAKELIRKADEIRQDRKEGINLPMEIINKKITLKDAIEDFKQDSMFTDLTKNYQMHYMNYFNHIIDFFGYKEPRKVKVTDIEDYYQYQLKHGNLLYAKRKEDGKVSKKVVTESNARGLSVNTLGKHKTALKQLWKFMMRKGGYGVTSNVVIYSEIPKVEIMIDGKVIKTRKIQPKQTPLSLEQLNYTLNDAIQNEHDRSIALMIALGAIGGLRRGEAVALKIGRYYHDEKMLLGEEMWELNDFKQIRQYYEEHNELILIDEAIAYNGVDELGFPKGGIIRMIAKPKCLDEIVEYAMEQRSQITNVLGVEMSGYDRLYMPLINVIQQNNYSSQKLSRKWKEYQQRRNKRMIEAGLKPIPEVRYHDLRHTHASLLGEELSVKKISQNMGHVIPGEGQINNTTTKVYIHDRLPDRSSVIDYWDKYIKLDWDKALRVNINSGDNRAHVNGSGHLVIMDEDKKRAMELRSRFVLTEEEEAELLCTNLKKE